MENAESGLNISALRAALIQAANAGDMKICRCCVFDANGNVLPASLEDRQFLYRVLIVCLMILEQAKNLYKSKQQANFCLRLQCAAHCYDEDNAYYLPGKGAVEQPRIS